MFNSSTKRVCCKVWSFENVHTTTESMVNLLRNSCGCYFINVFSFYNQNLSKTRCQSKHEKKALNNFLSFP